MSAATPGWLFIPAPTRDSFAIPASTLNPSAPISRASASNTPSSRGRSASGAVNDMSVVPSRETFCTIMSTLIASAAIALKIEAATPGRSGTSSIVTFASSVSRAAPEIITPSIGPPSSRTHVPGASPNEGRTWSCTP